MRFFILVFFFFLSLGIIAQSIDCLPTARTWKTEQLQGNVQSVWELELLPDSSVWEERRYYYDALGYLVLELRWDTARHIRHLYHTEYSYNEQHQVIERREIESQLTKGKAPIWQRNHTITYTYDKNGRFVLEQVGDSNSGDTTYFQFLYRAGGWVDACRITDAVNMTYTACQPAVSYRYNRYFCAEKIDYYFNDHSRHQLFYCDEHTRLAQERWYYLSSKKETKGDTLARFVMVYDYNTDTTLLPKAYRLTHYFQRTNYYDAIPAERRYEYTDWDNNKNWRQQLVFYSPKQVHTIKRVIRYF